MKNFIKGIMLLMMGLIVSTSCSGKTIVPFSTHEGSGLGSVVSDLKRLYPKANFKQAFDIYGHQVRGGKAKIDAWLKGLGY